MISSAQDDETQGFNNQFYFKGHPRDNGVDNITPCGAHIRKMNPHRAVPSDEGDGTGPLTEGCMLRRGITYGTDYDEGRGEGDRGLHFVCYQSSIDDGFRNVQMFWANPNEFPVPGSGTDSIIGNLRHDEPSRMFVSEDDKKKKGSHFEWKGLNPFVRPRGGEYFITPTLKALKETLSMA